MKVANNIPNNWKEIKIEDISLKINYGYTASSTATDTGVKFLRITDIQDYKVNWDEVPFCKIDENDIEKFLLQEGDIVFARTGATVGKSYLIEGKIPKAVFASYLIRIQLSNSINPKYIYYFFQSNNYWKQVGVKAVGIGQPNVNASALSKISLSLAPIQEQQYIVEKIEELFSELEQAEKLLNRTQKQLELYKNVILKNAFDGRLTEEWRNIHKIKPAFVFIEELIAKREKKGKVITQTKLKTAQNLKAEYKKSDDIPTWAVARLDSLITIAARVGWKGLKKEEYTETGPLLLSVHSLNFGKQVEFKDALHISNKRYEESPDIKLQFNDILLCKDGSGIGKIGIIKYLPNKATVNSSLLVIRANEAFDPDFLYYLLKGPHIQQLVSERISGSAVPHLFQKDFKGIHLKVPPKEEQSQIVREIEYHFTISENLELAIKNNLKKISAFKQAILKSAFEGKLFNPIEGNENTIELIELIKKEKIEYLSRQEKQIIMRPKNKKAEIHKKSILEILKLSNKPILARDVWQQSEHKEDIEAFYADIKKLQNKIIEIRKETETFLSLSK